MAVLKFILASIAQAIITAIFGLAVVIITLWIVF